MNEWSPKHWLATLQSAATIVGLLLTAGGLWYVGAQTRIQAETLQESRKVAAANFAVDIGHYLSEGRYDAIVTAIEDNDQPHPSTFPILKKSGGQFSAGDIDDYIGNYDDVGVLYKDGLLDEQMAYDEFSYDVEKAYCNNDVRNQIMEERKASGDMNDPNAFYMPFENLAKRFLALDRYTCANLENQ